jgi:glutathione S-transferase
MVGLSSTTKIRALIAESTNGAGLVERRSRPYNSSPMAGGPYVLYGDDKLDSPFVFSAFVALKEKSVPFALRLLDISAGETRTSAYTQRSLTARVPMLADGEFSLSESAAIVEYLDETLPAAPRLLPAGVEERARARQVLGWLRSDLAALRAERPTESIFYAHEKTPLGPKARADADKLVRITLELVGERSSIFETWSIADADLTQALMRLIANGDSVPPRVLDYANGVWRRPSVASWAALERPPKTRESAE